MIQVNTKVVMFDGSKTELMAELTALIRGFLEKGVIDKKDLDMIVNISFKSQEELCDECNDKIDEMLKKGAELKRKLDELDEEAKKHPEDKEKFDALSKFIRKVIDDGEEMLNDRT